MMDEFEDDVTGRPKLSVVNGADWLTTEPPEPDQILEDVFDRGDKLAIIGPSKLRKSFLLNQLLLSLASGRDFISLRSPQARKVLLCQFEIVMNHEHRRLRRMARAMAITPEDLGDRLQIINARGLGISGAEGVQRIMHKAQEIEPDLIAFDPLYKLATGAENATEDMKVILGAFDQMAEKTGAAIAYVHHDPKGAPGDRDIRDRGAGSNALGRDYDACITLTAHAQEPDAAIVDLLLRNYAPRDPFTILWTVEEGGAYCFEERPDIAPDKKTSKTKPQQPALSVYVPVAHNILGKDEMEVARFKETFKTQTGLTDSRIRDFLNWSTSGDSPHIRTRSLRSRGENRKWVSIGRELNA